MRNEVQVDQLERLEFSFKQLADLSKLNKAYKKVLELTSLSSLTTVVWILDMSRSQAQVSS